MSTIKSFEEYVVYRLEKYDMTPSALALSYYYVGGVGRFTDIEWLDESESPDIPIENRTDVQIFKLERDLKASESINEQLAGYIEVKEEEIIELNRLVDESHASFVLSEQEVERLRAELSEAVFNCNKLSEMLTEAYSNKVPKKSE